MKSSKFTALFAFVFLVASAALAAHVDMKNPRRALGREDDIRVDAQLVRDTVSPGSLVAATFQVQNLTSHWIAVAAKVSDVSYDSDSRTITLSLGAEIPDKMVPHLVAIAPGEKKTFTGGATVHIAVPARGPFTEAPQLVQIKVNVLRDVTALGGVIAAQSRSGAPVPMTQPIFDAWLDANDSILLNALPVTWSARDRSPAASAESQAPRQFGDDGSDPY